MSNDFLQATLSVTEFPVFNIKCKTKLNYFAISFIRTFFKKMFGLLYQVDYFCVKLETSKRLSAFKFDLNFDFMIFELSLC